MKVRVDALAVGVLGAALIAILVWLQLDRAPAPVARPESPDAAAASPAPSEKHAVEAAARPAVPDGLAKVVDALLQTADGDVHAELAGGGDRIDFAPRFALGVWQPTQSRLMIVLTERSLSGAETESLVAALSSGAGPDLRDAHALLEVTFVPTAQAFDASELNGAMLTVTNAAGASATIDVVQTLDWSGGLLPAGPPATNAPPPQVRLSATGRSPQEDSLQRSWRFSIAISVVPGE